MFQVIVKYIKKAKRFINRNNYSLMGNECKKNRVNLEWWGFENNLGDTLSPVVFQWVAKNKEINIEQEINKTKHVMAIGSIIGSGNFDATVWGSGIHKLSDARKIAKSHGYRKLDIRMVRGPVSRAFLIEAGYDCPSQYGDPAVLLPLIYSPKELTKKYEYSLISHYTKKRNDDIPNLHHINIMTNEYETFIDELLSSKKVISSSLHGIILAEVYGIEAVFLNDEMDSEIWKYLDWYYSTGRYDIKIANSIEEAMDMTPMALPNIEYMQKQLIESFPTDLWN